MELIERVLEIYGFKGLNDYKTKISCRILKNKSEFLPQINSLLPEIIKNYDNKAVGLQSNVIISEKVAMNFLRKFLTYNNISWNFSRDSNSTYVQLAKPKDLGYVHWTFDGLINHFNTVGRDYCIKKNLSTEIYFGDDLTAKIANQTQIPNNSIIQLHNLSDNNDNTIEYSIQYKGSCCPVPIKRKMMTYQTMDKFELKSNVSGNFKLEFTVYKYDSIDINVGDLWIVDTNNVFHADNVYTNGGDAVFNTTGANRGDKTINMSIIQKTQ